MSDLKFETLEDLANIFKTIGMFKPCRYYIDSLDWMMYIFEDVSTTELYINDWVCLLYDAHSGDEKGENMRLVGVKIKHYTHLKHSGVDSGIK
ncbi:MAG: hypothetical protein JWP44_4396 [Mucilaginibacter sp.]|nr:hypothetical protein [Mucilaginibacter sp.]